MSKNTTIDVEEYLGEQAGRDAYDRGERWSIAKPEEWRRGWIAQQHRKSETARAFASEKMANTNRIKPRELKAFEEAARNMRERDE